MVKNYKIFISVGAPTYPWEKACYNFNYLKGGIGGTNMKTEETKLTFYGNQAFAMLPLVGYILIGGTFSVGLHY